METFATPDDVVVRAQQILASRAYIPVDADNKLLANCRSATDLKPLKSYIALELAGKDEEHCMAFYFSPDAKLIKQVLVSKGTEKEVNSYPRTVLREGLLCNATYAVIAHNHPNGDKTPSSEDKSAAFRVAKLCDEVEIRMLMAFVVAGPTADDVVAIPPPDAKPALDKVIGDPDALIDMLMQGLKRGH